jgi:hypothetical protein
MLPSFSKLEHFSAAHMHTSPVYCTRKSFSAKLNEVVQIHDVTQSLPGAQTTTHWIFSYLTWTRKNRQKGSKSAMYVFEHPSIPSMLPMQACASDCPVGPELATRNPMLRGVLLLVDGENRRCSLS